MVVFSGRMGTVDQNTLDKPSYLPGVTMKELERKRGMVIKSQKKKWVTKRVFDTFHHLSDDVSECYWPN